MLEYIKRYFKKDKSTVIMLIIILAIYLGPAIYFLNTDEVIKQMTETPALGIICIIFLSVIIFFFLYICFIYLPITSPKSQDDKEYNITKEKEKIHVIFKNTELLLSSEDIYLDKKYIRDINNNPIPHLRLKQIYNYIKAKYLNLLEKEVENNKNVINKDEVVNRFSNVRTMNLEEKEEYIKRKKLDYGLTLPLITCSIISLFFLIPAVVCKSIIATLIILTLSILLYKVAINSYKKRSNLAKRIRNETMYTATCIVYDKKEIREYDEGTTITYNYIKITDGKYIVDEWIFVPKDLYKPNLDKVEIYIFDNRASDVFEIL